MKPLVSSEDTIEKTTIAQSKKDKNLIPTGVTKPFLITERGKSLALLQQKWSEISGPKVSVIGSTILLGSYSQRCQDAGGA